jgi:predicted DNA-binding transcriptional regulator YafY
MSDSRLLQITALLDDARELVAELQDESTPNIGLRQARRDINSAIKAINKLYEAEGGVLLW